MIKRLSFIWFPIFTALAAALCACSDEPVMPADETVPLQQAQEGDVYIRFQLSLADNGIPGGTRAGEPYLTPGTSRESVVNTVDLFVYDAATNTLMESVALDGEQIAAAIAGGGAVVQLSAADGMDISIYAVVNMPEKARGYFVPGVAGNAASIVSGKTDYWDVMEDFIPFSSGSQENLENDAKGCIPMTGQFEYAGSTVITVDRSKMTEASPMKVHADVCRMVAKIHVLAKTKTFKLVSTGEVVEYANAAAADYVQPAADTGDEGYGNWMGWIRKANVRYIPNGINKASYLFPQPFEPVGDVTSGYSPWRDSNMDLDYYVSSGKDIGLGFDAPRWSRDFVFYNGLALHKENVSPRSHFAQVETFSQDSLDNTINNSDVAERYTKGLYCLENYFYRPALFDSYSSYQDAVPMVTHVSIAAKLTPREIIILDNFAAAMDLFVERYENYPSLFESTYELSIDDFSEVEAEKWRQIKEKYKEYFTSDEHKFRSFRRIRLGNEPDAVAIITWSLKANKLWSRNPEDFESGKYPAGTFYVYDRKYDSETPSAQKDRATYNQQYLYLTAGVVAAATGDDMYLKTYSVPHVGGWGYYYTYLNGINQSLPDGAMTPFYCSQVARNTYYIVTVNNFGVPGGSVSRPEYIKVNTVPVGWNYAGSGNINLY